MIDLFFNFLISAWWGFGAVVYLWVLTAWLRKPSEGQAKYPGAPIIALVVIPLWPLIFFLVLSDNPEETPSTQTKCSLGHPTHFCIQCGAATGHHGDTPATHCDECRLKEVRAIDVSPLEAYIDELTFNQPPRDFRCETCNTPMEDRGADMAWCSNKCLKIWEKSQ